MVEASFHSCWLFLSYKIFVERFVHFRLEYRLTLEQLSNPSSAFGVLVTKPVSPPTPPGAIICTEHTCLPSFWRESNSWHPAASRSLTFDSEAAGCEARDPPMRKMRNCEWATSHPLIFIALSALLSYPTTGRAGWGADPRETTRKAQR